MDTTVKEKPRTKIEVSADIMATCLNELAPNVSKEDWLQHINNTKDDPRAFFGANGEGYNEYQAFVNTHDKETYQKKVKADKAKKDLEKARKRGIN